MINITKGDTNRFGTLEAISSSMVGIEGHSVLSAYCVYCGLNSIMRASHFMRGRYCNIKCIGNLMRLRSGAKEAGAKGGKAKTYLPTSNETMFLLKGRQFNPEDEVWYKLAFRIKYGKNTMRQTQAANDREA